MCFVDLMLIMMCFPSQFTPTARFWQIPICLGLDITHNIQKVRVSIQDIHLVCREHGDLASLLLLFHVSTVILDNIPNDFSGHLHVDKTLSLNPKPLVHQSLHSINTIFTPSTYSRIRKQIYQTIL